MTTARFLLIALPIAGIFLLVGLAALILLREARRQDMEDRIQRAVWGQAGDPRSFVGIANALHRLGEWLRRSGRLYSEQDLEHLQGLLGAAGYNPRRALPTLLVAKLVLTIGLPVLAGIAGMFLFTSLATRGVVVGVALILGVLLPEKVLSVMKRSYVAALESGTPDALDLLVVCSEAGMGLESAIERVSQEMMRSNRPVALALTGLVDDLRVLPDRRVAFGNFARRTGVEGLQRLAAMLAQALQLGTPLGQALRGVANELRRDRINKLEEKAVKLPAKLIFPLVVFIMPALTIALVGSSFLRLYDSLSSMTRNLRAPHHITQHLTHLPGPRP